MDSVEGTTEAQTCEPIRGSTIVFKCKQEYKSQNVFFLVQYIMFYTRFNASAIHKKLDKLTGKILSHPIYWRERNKSKTVN